MIPLPEPYAVHELWGQNVDVYDARQMHAHAAESVAAQDAEIKRLQSELSKCGKDNCMGRLSREATNWVTVASRDAAVASERERCARLCDIVAGCCADRLESRAATRCAGAIRGPNVRANRPASGPQE